MAGRFTFVSFFFHGVQKEVGGMMGRHIIGLLVFVGILSNQIVHWKATSKLKSPPPLRHAMAETDGAELVEAGLRPQTATERLRGEILKRLRERAGEGREEALAALYPDVVLDLETLETLTAAFLGGAHALMLGPPGSGKTSLAKATWDLVPKEVFAVAGCPVQDDPWSLMDASHARRVPACPVCRENHGEDPEEIDPKQIPVNRMRLREGYGYARVQGSPEVFPDNLTGTLNLARLEEIGDPNSPLVLEPGKVLQANRGMLLVDEVGKLPRGTQNVLLQALQEHIASPAKSRATFPADFVAVATSNLRDLGNVVEPLTDRLANVHVAFPEEPAANRRIIDLALRASGGASANGAAQIPGPYRDAAVRLVMRWRRRPQAGDDLGEVGSNRAMVDLVQRAWSHAILSGDARLEPEDFRRGARDAMMGRIRARSADGFDENRDAVSAFVEKEWREAAQEGARSYWCRFFEGELKGDNVVGERILKALRDAVETHRDAPDKLQGLLRKDGGDPDVRRFAQFMQKEEGLDRQAAAAMLPVVFHALEALEAFES